MNASEELVKNLPLCGWTSHLGLLPCIDYIHGTILQALVTQPIEGFITILAWGELESKGCSLIPYPHVIIFDISLTGINMSN